MNDQYIKLYENGGMCGEIYGPTHNTVHCCWIKIVTNCSDTQANNMHTQTWMFLFFIFSFSLSLFLETKCKLQTVDWMVFVSSEFRRVLDYCMTVSVDR